MSRNNRAPLRLSTLAFPLILGAISGCASGGESLLRFPENDTSYIVGMGVYHGVTLVLEYPGEPSSLKGGSVLPRSRGLSEFYDFGEDHQFEYRTQFDTFYIGPFRHRSQEGGILYIFLEREGSWSFEFHGQRIILDIKGRWKPSLFRRIVEITERARPGSGGFPPGGRMSAQSREARTTRLESDEIHAGGFRIVYRPEESQLEIDGSWLRPDPRRALVLEPGVGYRLERR